MGNRLSTSVSERKSDSIFYVYTGVYLGLSETEQMHHSVHSRLFLDCEHIQKIKASVMEALGTDRSDKTL